MKNERNIDFRVSTKSQYTQSGVEMHRHERFPIFQRGLGGFSSQSPEDFISYNRYSYCLFNPFKYIDPSGEYRVYYDPATLKVVPKGTEGANYYDEEEDEDEGAAEKALMHKRFKDGYNINRVKEQSLLTNWGFGSSSPGVWITKDYTAEHNRSNKNDKNESDQDTKTKNANVDVLPWTITATALTAADWAAVGSFIVAGLPAALIFLTAAIPSSERLTDNMMRRAARRDQHTSQSKKHHPPNWKKNDEFEGILKKALKAAKKEWSPERQEAFHRSLESHKDDSGNVPKQLLKRLAKEFAEGL